MQIGEIAAFFGVSVKAMRVYERMGILQPVKIDGQTGYRYYAVDQVRRLDAILELKRLGFSLAEIRELLAAGMTNEKYMEALVHKKTVWQDRIAYAEHQIKDIDEIIEQLEEARPATKLHELTEDERARLLNRLVCVEDIHAQNILSEALWV